MEGVGFLEDMPFNKTEKSAQTLAGRGYFVRLSWTGIPVIAGSAGNSSEK
jgi:hypothetical protein